MNDHYAKTPEAQCLSALMKSSSDVYAAVSAGLTENHFQNLRLREIFAAILRAAGSSKDTSVHAVWLELGEKPADRNPITIAELCDIEGIMPTSLHRHRLVEVLLDADKLKKLTDALAGAISASKEQARGFDDVWANVAPFIESAQRTTATNKVRTIADMAESLASQIEKPDTRKLIDSGFTGWDRLATPLRAGEMVTIAARPGCGKTAIALQIATKVAARGSRVAFFSLEMSGEELVDRVAKVQGGRETLEVASIRAIGKMKSLHVYDNQERHTIAAIEARAKLLATMPGGLELVVVDYLQLVEPSDRRMPREQQVAEMSRRLKQLAGMIGCPVIVVAQLNRESEKDERRPKLSDLRESGAIEQDSDRVWFLWQDPKTVLPGSEDARAIEIMLIQSKCRGGPPNVAARMHFNRPVFTFSQISSR